MDLSDLEKKIPRHLLTLKRRLPVSLDVIVDHLIVNSIVSYDFKDEVDAQKTPSEKVHTLIRKITRLGNEACIVFVQAMGQNGLADLATDICRTDIKPNKASPKGQHHATGAKRTEGDGMSNAVKDNSTPTETKTTGDDHALESKLEQMRVKMEMNLEQKFKEKSEKMEMELDRKFQDKADELQATLTEKIAALQAANTDLNDKIVVLEHYIKKIQAEDSSKDSEIDRLQSKNEQLQKELERLKKDVSKEKSLRNQRQEETIRKLKKDLDEKNARLLEIQNVVTNKTRRKDSTSGTAVATSKPKRPTDKQ